MNELHPPPAGLAPETKNIAEKLASVLSCSIIGQLAQALALMASIGFIFSSFFNSLVFSTWGLNFMQIASPSDVVMSGLYVFTYLAMAIGSIASAYFVSSGILSFTAARLPKWVRPLLIILLEMICVCLVYLSFDLWPRPLSFVTLSFTLTANAVFIAGFRVSYPLALFHLGTSRTLHEDDSRLKITRSFLILGPSLFLSLLYLSSEFRAIQEVGYFGSYYYIDPDKTACEGRVMWTGERELVVACGLNPKSDFRIMKDSPSIKKGSRRDY